MQEQTSELSLRSKQLEEAFDQLKAASEQLRSIAQSRFRMLQGVSHELRNALQEVSFGAAILLEDEAAAEERSETVATMTRHAARLQRVLDRLQEFSSILAGESSLHIDFLDLGEFVREIEKTHRVNAERKGLEFRCSQTVEPPQVKTDHEKLRHIADILLSNALEYTQHGTVEVATVAAESGDWTFSVVDTGAGIHERDAKMVFHEFHRSARTTGHGVGLGLIIAQYLAHLMHGEITFASRHGEGSRFDVTLPRDLSEFAA